MRSLRQTFLSLYFLRRAPETAPVLALSLVLLGLTQAAAMVLGHIPEATTEGALAFLTAAMGGIVDLLICTAAMSVIFSMPVNAGGIEAQVPLRERVRLARNEIVEETEDLERDYKLCPTTPEDYTSLISSLTYTWMEPIQKLSLKRPLLPSDIWRLRSINDTRLLSDKFAKLKFNPKSNNPRTLAQQLLVCNANDIALDFVYKLCGVTLAYAGPALMKAILQCISDAAESEGSTVWALSASGIVQKNKSSVRSAQTEPSWTPRSKAFVLTLLGLVFTLIRYVAEFKNFHHARQVGLRLRSTLVIGLFEKALRRRTTAAAGAAESSPSASSDSPAMQKADSSSQQAEVREETEGSPSESRNDTTPGERSGEAEPLLQNGKAKEPQRKEISEDHNSKNFGAQQMQADVGKLVNMMASDINVLLRLGCDSHQLYGAPLEVIIATVFLYQLLGWAALAGLSLLVLGLPVNYYLGQLYMRTQHKWRVATDERISLVAELVSAVRYIKIQGSQSRWTDRVMRARRREMRRLVWARVNEYFMVIFWSALPIASTLLTFYCYVVIQGNELTIPVAFTTLTLSSMLRAPLNVIPSFAMKILQAIISVRRLEGFLHEEEIDETVSTLKRQAVNVGNIQSPSVVLRLENASFTWGQGEADNYHVGLQNLVLEDLTLDFPAEGLSVIEGPTASGKSSLLAALLGELRRQSGTQTVPKFDSLGRSQISYAAQSPWLEAGKSVRDNIVFVTAFDAERYKCVIEACALTEDLQQLSDGDETRISKETLSGGQKARISLARALYHCGHTVLLDDVLSAVDTRVQRHLYHHALTGAIAKGRRLVLATHHVSLILPSVAYLVRLHNGRLVAADSPASLRQKGLLPEDSDDSASSSGEVTPSTTTSDDCEQRIASPGKQTQVKYDGKCNRSGREAPIKGKTARLLYELEARQEGNIRWGSYLLYMRAAPRFLWIVVLFLGIALRIASASEQYWLKLWGEANMRPAFGLPPAKGHELFYIGVYGGIGLGTVVLVGFRGIFFWIATYIASKRLYAQLLHSIVRARMQFFDRNPTGRILQRFNLDVSVVDSDLPQSALGFLLNMLNFATSALICIVIVPAFSLPVVAGLFFAFWGVRGFFKTTMYMQRIESTSTSPMYSAFTQILEGLATVRAFGAEAHFLDRMQTIASITSAQWWAICTIEVWVSFRAQIISGISVFIATTLALTGAVSPGSAGMVISSSSMLTTFAYYLTYEYKQVSNNGNSVERIKEYIEIKQEAPEIVERRRVPAAWPSSGGRMEVRNLSVRYDDDLPEVLHSISFDVNPREKVAVVGRTGSGKSSLVSALLRAVEPSSSTSSIIIDGLDILQLGLEYRSRISVVSQDPILFSGTIRQNLDPFGEKSDEECQWALDRVGVNRHTDDAAQRGDRSTYASRQPITLHMPVQAGSANLSAGQAQLICLARALLRDARIVILDEATSSTDFETDASIQNAIRDMRESIIIAVAHRLTTVIDYDRILVMHKGDIVEFDTPQALLSKDDADQQAHFKHMCQEAGPATYRQLCAAARVSHST